MQSQTSSNQLKSTSNVSLAGKVALITGASRGIGAAAARLFARQGASVVLAARGLERLECVAQDIQASGSKALAVQTDVTQAAQVEALVQQSVAAFGRLDIAFNNAGSGGGNKSLLEYTEQEFDWVIETNLKSTFLCMKYEIPAMLAGGGGAILNMSSAVGLVGFSGLAPYVAGKHGVVGLTKSAALEFAHRNIRINVLAPGSIRTEKMDQIIKANPQVEQGISQATPMGRPGSLEEVAEAALWLCSEASAFVTGVTLPVDGGFVVP